MPSRLVVDAPNATEFARDLESIQVGMEKRVGAVRREAADIVAGRARRLTPVGPGPIAGAKHPDDRLPHIRDTIAGRVAGVVTTHPGGVVHEHGGTIAPRGARVQTIRIAKSAMARKAGARETPRIEALLARRFDELLAQAGLK